MKFLLPLLPLLFANFKHFFKEPGEGITQQVVLKIRSIVVLIVITIASLVLSCVGISLFVSKLATQLDADGPFYWTPGLSVCLGLALISVGTLLYSLSRAAWLQKMRTEDQKLRQEKQGKGRPIENALALLLMDFLEDRRSRRRSQATDPIQD